MESKRKKNRGMNRNEALLNKKLLVQANSKMGLPPPKSVMSGGDGADAEELLSVTGKSPF